MNWLWMGGHAPRSKNCVVCFCLFSKRIVVEMDKKLYLQQKFKTNPKKCFDHIWGFIYAKRQTNYCSKSYKNRLKTSVLRRFLVRVGRLELPASCSQSKRATNCATPGYSYFLRIARRRKKVSFYTCQHYDDWFLNSASSTEKLLFTMLQRGCDITERYSNTGTMRLQVRDKDDIIIYYS